MKIYNCQNLKFNYINVNKNTNKSSNAKNTTQNLPQYTNKISFSANIKNFGLPAKNYDLNGKTILITGATGTLGTAILNELVQNYSPKEIIVFSRDEYKQYKMKHSIPKNAPIKFIIGDVRDEYAIKNACQNADVIIHTAAMKHVSICEENKEETIKTNFFGTLNTINAAINSNVKRMIFISTDKAANPNNHYGISKKIAENLIKNANINSDKEKKFSIIRMGNILGSRGSVLPLFEEQKKNGVLTVTDTNMTRFFITPKQAAKQVLSSIEIMHGGEIFIPKLKSTKIIDLAKQTAPECEIKIIGAQKGEKLHEELLDDTEKNKTYELIDRYVILPRDSICKEATLLKNTDNITSDDEKITFSKDELNAIIQECLSKN